MELVGGRRHCALNRSIVILLDTNALLWLERSHPRSRALRRWAGRLYVSPATLLELQFLREIGRIRLRTGAHLVDLATNLGCPIDDPPALAWFEEAQNLSWTRDPFDRLIVAHARLRGWKLATGDELVLQHLGDGNTIEL